jgi:hypothetical protein
VSNEVGRSALAQDRGAGAGSGAGQAGCACSGEDWAGGVFGTLAHPPSARTRPASTARRPGATSILSNLIDTGISSTTGIEPTVVWLAFEILLGLAAFGLLVWWTLPRGKRDEKDGPPGP